MISNILSKLNIGEQMELRAYIGKQVEKKALQMQGELEKAATEREDVLKKLNDDTWHRIETWLHMAMREHKISEKRIKDIDARVLELANKYENKLLIGEDIKSKYKVLEDEDFRSIIEILIDRSCRNCNKHSKGCEVFGILKKYDIPYPTGERRKCKYGYGR